MVSLAVEREVANAHTHLAHTYRCQSGQCEEGEGKVVASVLCEFSRHFIIKPLKI